MQQTRTLTILSILLAFLFFILTQRVMLFGDPFENEEREVLSSLSKLSRHNFSEIFPDIGRNNPLLDSIKVLGNVNIESMVPWTHSVDTACAGHCYGARDGCCDTCEEVKYKFPCVLTLLTCYRI